MEDYCNLVCVLTICLFENRLLYFKVRYLSWVLFFQLNCSLWHLVGTHVDEWNVILCG